MGDMYLPLLTQLSAGTSINIADVEWPSTVDAALAGDEHAVQRLFSAAARWANRIIHRRPWLEDAEADVVSIMWVTLTEHPANSDQWRRRTLKKLSTIAYRPSVEEPVVEVSIEEPGRPVEATVIGRLDAVAELHGLRPWPASVQRFAAAVLNDGDVDHRTQDAAYRWRCSSRVRAVAR